MSPSRPHAAFTPARLAVTTAGLVALLALCALGAALVGPTPVSLRAALSDPSSRDAEILFVIRVPWVLLAASVGACLSTAGAAFQSLLRNPLADPYILGVSGGASLGVILAFTVGGPLLVAPFVSVPLCGFLGALAATLLVWRLSSVDGQTNRYTMLLSGVVVNALLGAVIMTIVSMARPEDVHRTALWLMGVIDVFQVERPLLYGTAGLSLVGVVFFCLLGKDLNALSLGEDMAHHLGTDVAHTRRKVFFAGAFLVGAATSVAGPIGFVGLLVPHLLRLLVGPDHRVLMMASALGGAAFLLVAGSLARMAFPLTNSQVPVGIVTACLGGPFFLWLLRKRGRLYG